jgi:hypothetical protein
MSRQAICFRSRSFRFLKLYSLTLDDKGLGGERRMFENAFANAVSMLLLVFGVSVAFIILSGYLWSRVRQKRQLE